MQQETQLTCYRLMTWHRFVALGHTFNPVVAYNIQIMQVPTPIRLRLDHQIMMTCTIFNIANTLIPAEAKRVSTMLNFV